MFVAIVFASVLFYHFTLVFTDARRERSTLRLTYGLAAIVSVLSVAGFVATGPEMAEKFYGYAPVFGWGFPLYLVAAYLPIVLAFRVLIHRVRSLENPDERIRVIYVMVGAGMPASAPPPIFWRPKSCSACAFTRWAWC